jgi:MFS family permease
VVFHADTRQDLRLVAATEAHVNDSSSATARPSPWAPLSFPTFRALWIATVVSNIGAAMQAVGSGWLMTSMSPSPLLVALVQAATMLPMFFFVLPAGVLGDILDRRRLLILAQLWSLASALALAVITLTGWISPWLLLLFTFCLGMGTALQTPPFQAIVNELVPRDRMASAVALNSMGLNIARALGPAVGGVLIAAAGPASVFLFNAVSFTFVIVVLCRWKRQPRAQKLPPEHFFSAMRVGWRYTRQNPQLLVVLIRAAAFFAFAAALWALLPLIGKQKLESGPNGYAILLSCIGVGAVVAVFTLPKIRERISADALTVGSALLFAVATAAPAIFDSFYVVAGFMVVGGWAWLACLTTFNVAAQFAIADWVKSRGLAMYQIAFFGALALGSIAWGQVAAATSVTSALWLASGALVLGCLMATRFRLESGGGRDLQPALSWPEPHVLLTDTASRGVILTTIDYQVDPADREAFLRAMLDLKSVRRRNGGYRWGLYEDVERPGRFVEHFLTDSWIEHLRQHERLTVSDRAIQQRANAFHKDAAPPRVTHFAAPGEYPADGGHR